MTPAPFALGYAAAGNPSTLHPPAARGAESASKANRTAEASLIHRAQQGDSGAITELYHRHAGQIYRYCLFRVSDQVAAEDLTAEVFLKMLEAISRYVQSGVPFVAWLYRIAHDRVADYHRAKARRQAEELSDHMADGRPEPEDRIMRKIETRQLRDAMGRLRDEQQTVLLLRFIEGHSLSETAQRMGKTTGAVKSMQCRALRQLARQLGDARCPTEIM